MYWRSYITLLAQSKALNKVEYLIRLITKLHEESRNKNPQVRAKFSQYFLVVLNTYSEDLLEKFQPQIEEFINNGLTDAKPEVR